jgi:hypothetical protein
MGLYSNGIDTQPHFRPKAMITQAEIATALSRMLWGNKYQGTEEYRYQNHLLALQKKKIMRTGIDPKANALRGQSFESLMNIVNR